MNLLQLFEMLEAWKGELGQLLDKAAQVDTLHVQTNGLLSEIEDLKTVNETHVSNLLSLHSLVDSLHEVIQNREGEVLTLKSRLVEVEAVVVSLNALIVRLREQIEELSQLPEEPPVIDPSTELVLFRQNNPSDVALFKNFAETAMRTWDFGGHNVPWDKPGFVKRIEDEYEGYWHPDIGSEPWLFDRPSSFYKAFELTGDQRFLEHANTLTVHYARHIDKDGFFDLKLGEKDTKFVYLAPFLYYRDYGGDISQYSQKIDKMWTVSNAGYNSTRTFDEIRAATNGIWTEREAGLHCATAWNYYLLTGKDVAKEKAISIINQMGDGLNFVSYTKHEGGGPGGTYPQHLVSSPWMMALYFQSIRPLLGQVSDALDHKILTQAANYGGWMVQPYELKYLKHTYNQPSVEVVVQCMNGFVWGETYHVENTGILSPRYLTGESVGDGIPEADNLYHGLDVLGMMHFCRYAALRLGRDVSGMSTAIWELERPGGTVERSFFNLTRPSPPSSFQLPKYRAKPARIWNWWVRGRYELMPLPQQQVTE